MLDGRAALQLPAARRSSPAARAPRRRSRSPIRPPRARRPGRRGRRCCCCSCCSASQPDRRRHALETRRAARASVVGGRSIRLSGRPRLRPAVGRRASRTAAYASRRHEHEDRGPQPGLVPGAADRLRRHRVDRLAARRRARRRRARRDAVRVGRLAHEGEARVRSSRSAPSEQIGRTLPGAAARALRATRAPTSST